MKFSVSEFELGLNWIAPVIVDPPYSVTVFETLVEIFANEIAVVGEVIVP